MAPTSQKTIESENITKDVATESVEKKSKNAAHSDFIKVGPGTNPGSGAQPEQKSTNFAFGTPVSATRSLMASDADDFRAAELRGQTTHLRTAA